MAFAAPSSSTCRRFIMNHALQNHSPILTLQCSLANAQNFTRVISFRSKVLKVRSGTKIYPSRNDNEAPLSSFFCVKSDIRCKSSYFGMPISVSNYGLRNQTCSIHNASVRKPISKVPIAAIVVSEDGNSSKNGKGVKARATKKKSVISVDEENATALKDVDTLQLEGQTVENDVNSVISKRIRTPKTNEKVKQTPRSKKTVKKASAATALTDTADPPIKSRKKSQKSSETNATSSTLTVTEVVKEGDVLTSDGVKEARKNSTKKLKPATKSSKKAPVQYSHVTDVAMSQRHDAWPQLYPPITKSVLVVESVTKAKVIQGYLGEMFEVLPSYGHVRDLAARSGSVRPDDDFSMVWEVPSAAWSHLKSIKVALSGADNLILASDPDREGEAIAWHIIEMLKQQDALHENVTVARVVFNQITESSIKTALQTPRVIDANLVHAYLARRALDYLIGFNVSPLLWRKLPGCQSAGRVQSAALALICDREKEIQEFKAQEYWTVGVEFHKKDQSSSNPISLTAHLTHFDSKKLNQLSITSQDEANDIEGKVNASTFEVVSSKFSKTRRNPPAPYITSTLQQDAANKFNFTASYTMKVAQKLYEGIQLSNGKAAGLITYMRTDGVHLSDEAAKDIQSFVAEKYGQDFASKVTRKFFKKVKNAQEAHEAIRPTDIRRLPSNLFGVLDEDSVKLYSLIWSRTMACQMEPAIVGQIQVDIGNASQSTLFRSTCSRVEFLGYKAAYEDAEITPLRNNEDEEEKRNVVYETLSKLKNGQSLSLSKVEIDQHHTQPPPRYSEGSLVKKMEELGIGRPSTYASTIKVLKDRNYIKMENRMLCPEFRGRMVSAFLSHYFSEVTDYSFTADMETELDNVSDGMTEWKGLLKDYWTRFSKYCELAGNVHIHQVEKMLEKTFGDFLFSSIPDGKRNCPSCMEGTLIFKVSRYGAGYFIGCDQHPKCKYIAKTLYGEEEDDEENGPENKRTDLQEPKLLGLNPGSNEQVLLKCGPYGYYVQLGEDRKGHLPKRASASRIKDASSITLEDALELLKYPVTLGKHPDDDQPIVLKLAKAGFAISHRRNNVSVPKNLKRSEVNMEKALELLQSKGVRRRGRPKREVVEAL